MLDLGSVKRHPSTALISRSILDFTYQGQAMGLLLGVSSLAGHSERG